MKIEDRGQERSEDTEDGTEDPEEGQRSFVRVQRTRKIGQSTCSSEWSN